VLLPLSAAVLYSVMYGVESFADASRLHYFLRITLKIVEEPNPNYNDDDENYGKEANSVYSGVEINKNREHGEQNRLTQ
jgi:hypothetical protein